MLYDICILEKANEKIIKVVYILKIHKAEECINGRHVDIQIWFFMVLILSADASKTSRTFYSTELTVIALFGTAFINYCGSIDIRLYIYIYSFHHLMSPRWKSQLIGLNVQSLVTQSWGTQEWLKPFSIIYVCSKDFILNLPVLV